jgi:hypothetical protein
MKEAKKKQKTKTAKTARTASKTDDQVDSLSLRAAVTILTDEIRLNTKALEHMLEVMKAGYAAPEGREPAAATNEPN